MIRKSIETKNMAEEKEKELLRKWPIKGKTLRVLSKRKEIEKLLEIDYLRHSHVRPVITREESQKRRKK